MSDWMSGEDRKKATYKFVKQLQDNQAVRQDCLKYPWAARELLKELGGFSNMPASVEIRVLENKESSLDNLALILLPDSPIGDESSFDMNKVWVCCWSRWAGGGNPSDSRPSIPV